MGSFNFGEWEARLVDNWDRMQVDLYLMRRTPQGKELLTHAGKIVQVVANTAVKEGNYFARLEREQVQAFADAFASYGIKNANDHKNEGLLEATKYHLEDMRRIAFEPPQEVVRVVSDSKPNKSSEVSP